MGEREQEDVGVKFAAWATTTDRLYTGSSDGIVKVWNIRQGKAVLVRRLIEVAGPITYGAFSPDCTKLVIGDGAGRVHLLDLDEGDIEDTTKPASSTGLVNLQIGGRKMQVRRPRQIVDHPEPPPPATDGPKPTAQLGSETAREYLQRGELRLVPDPRIGAVQGPSYADTGLFRAEAHRHGDANEPLLSVFERLQQDNNLYSGPRRVSRRAPAVRKIRESQAFEVRHEQNYALDLDFQSLDLGTRLELETDRVDLAPDEPDYDLNYEDTDYDSEGTA